ncbi:ankyrin repeat domain-containing protein [bacterium]|nr:ankyrin repeat domain-containing protein [bacterium]
MKKIIFTLTLCLGLNLSAQQEDLSIAIEMDNVSGVKKMIESGRYSVNEKLRSNTPIIAFAAQVGAEKVANYLIANQADVNALNRVKESALMMAVYFYDSPDEGTYAIHDRIAKALIAAGANLEIEDGWAPLAYAAYAGRLEIAKYLLSRGALINGPVKDKVSSVNTPLMMASMQGHEHFVRYLLIQGADARLRNTREATAYSLAEKYNHQKVMRYLQCALNLAPGEPYLGKCE